MTWTRGCEIGKGSTATVYTAAYGGETLAVKSTEIPNSRFLQREKEILATLSSPHVVGYKGFDVSEERNELYYNMFMEYIPGGTLAEEIRRSGGRLDEQTIKAYTRQILRGAEYLHSEGVAHCDIKGGNILISREHGVKLADFGCSKRADCDSNDAFLISGTPVYMAPEVARGEEQGIEADIWAIGCTVIEMATGGSAWPDSGSDPARILYRIAFSDQIPSFPSSLSEQGKDFLSKCLVRDRKERWTAKELLTHPFVTKLGTLPTPNSISPTSVLDHQLWSSSDGESERTQMNVVEASTSEKLEDDFRISQLASVSKRPNWGSDSDEDWIPVRSKSGSICQIKCRVDDGCRLGLDDAAIDLGRCSYDSSIINLIRLS